MTEPLERRMSGEIRTDGARRLKGYAIRFNALSEDLGGFRERILPEAMERTIREALDVRALIDHDSSKIIGRTKAGTLRMQVDGRGVAVVIDPPNTSYARDVMESVSRGDVSGMSFAFRMLTDDWHLEDGMPVREVSDMIVREFSVVTFPAYPQTSIDVAQRSLDAFNLAHPRKSIAWLRNYHKQQMAR